VKVLVAGAPLRPDWTGGEPVVAHAVAAGLSTRGFEVQALPTGRSMSQMVAMSLSPADWDPASYLSYSRRLDAGRPDVVLAFYDYDCSLIRACERIGVPVVASVHIYWPLCPVGTLYIEGQGICQGPSLDRCLRHMSRGVPPTRLPVSAGWIPAPLGLAVHLKSRRRVEEMNSCSQVVVPSERMRDLLQRFGVRRAMAVPNGLPLEEFVPTAWSGERKRVLFASGASSERKGFPEFERLATTLRGRDSVEFAATSYDGPGPVVALGRLRREGVLRAMREAYAVVAPSLWEEPFSLTIHEAMASAKPVVAYDVGGNRELLGDAGVVVPLGDSGALARATDDLLADPDRAIALGRRARARVESMYSSTRMIDGYAGVLRSVL
jgi:glycosyltransferase involved in cell wall biosynthesis